MINKNFTCNNVTGKRKKGDFYETPFSITRHILELEKLDPLCSILEPMCGNNAIVDVLEAQNYKNVRAYDITQGTNFFDENNRYDVVLTNPAFSVALETILKAKSVAKNKIILLLPLNYLHGKQRYDQIYQDRDFPLQSVSIFTRYPMLGDSLRQDGKYRTGMMVYAWFVWCKQHRSEPTIRWIDNNYDILSKR